MGKSEPSSTAFTSPRLSRREWKESVESLPRLKDTMRTATRRVLVEGQSSSDVSRDMGVSRQAVSAGVQRVIAKHLELEGKAGGETPHDLLCFAVPREHRGDAIRLIREFLTGPDRFRKKKRPARR